MPIGQLAARAGVHARTIRYYEAIGLLPEPTRLPNGYRVYSEDDLSRLAFIRQAQSLGLSLATVKDILALHDVGDRPCQHVHYLAEAKIADIDHQIGHLMALRERMLKLVARAAAEADHASSERCPICPAITSTL